MDSTVAICAIICLSIIICLLIGVIIILLGTPYAKETVIHTDTIVKTKIVEKPLPVMEEENVTNETNVTEAPTTTTTTTTTTTGPPMNVEKCITKVAGLKKGEVHMGYVSTDDTQPGPSWLSARALVCSGEGTGLQVPDHFIYNKKLVLQ